MVKFCALKNVFGKLFWKGSRQQCDNLQQSVSGTQRFTKISTVILFVENDVFWHVLLERSPALDVGVRLSLQNYAKQFSGVAFAMVCCREGGYTSMKPMHILGEDERGRGEKE